MNKILLIIIIISVIGLTVDMIVNDTLKINAFTSSHGFDVSQQLSPIILSIQNIVGNMSEDRHAEIPTTSNTPNENKQIPSTPTEKNQEYLDSSIKEQQTTISGSCNSMKKRSIVPSIWLNLDLEDDILKIRGSGIGYIEGSEFAHIDFSGAMSGYNSVKVNPDGTFSTSQSVSKHKLTNLSNDLLINVKYLAQCGGAGIANIK